MKRENYDLEDRLIEFAVQAIDIAEALPRNLFIFACPPKGIPAGKNEPKRAQTIGTRLCGQKSER